MDSCKRCLLEEASQNDIYNDIHQRIEKLSPNDKVSDEMYKTRINKCKECEHLLAGVCIKCGCYVEFRSAFIKLHCPLPSKKKKW